jgi:hypothetical protein
MNSRVRKTAIAVLSATLSISSAWAGDKYRYDRHSDYRHHQPRHHNSHNYNHYNRHRDRHHYRSGYKQNYKYKYQYKDNHSDEKLLVGLLVGSVVGYAVGQSSQPRYTYQSEYYSPPRVERPRPAPPPATVRYQPPDRQSNSCLQEREYQTRVIVGGREVDAYGTACLQPDGSWYRGPAQMVSY